MSSRALRSFAAILVTVPSLALAQPPMAHWTFDNDGATQVVDASGYGNHGEVVGALSYHEGVSALGIELSGSGDRVEVPSSESLDNLEAFTFSAWVRTADDSNQAIVAKDERTVFFKIGAFRHYLKGCIRVGKLVCSVSFDDVVPVDEWVFVAMTYDGGGDRMVRLYINGEEAAYRSQADAAEGRDRNSDAGEPLAIGAIPLSGQQGFKGAIDEVRIYGRALSATELRGLFEQDLGAPIVDTVSPLVTITEPDSDFVTTRQATIDIAGTAIDAGDIVDVAWSTSGGELGAVVGGTSWRATAVPLQLDENIISVTAWDAAGNASSASLRVLYTEEEPSSFEGYGAATTGGSGYPRFIATSPQEFAAALNEVNGRDGNASISLVGDWEYDATVQLAHVRNVTLDGTGANVTFRDTSLIVKCSENVILQGLRVRNNQQGGDAIQINSSERVVIDHVSASGAGDGNIDITGWSCGPSRYVTVSWSIFADTWKQSLVKYGGTTKVSFHHNLFYNNGNRLPALQSEGEFDIRNNIFWQWGSSGTSLQAGALANLVGNVYAPGTPNRGHAAIWYQDELSKAWIADNQLPSAETDVSRLDQPISVPTTTTHAPGTARALIIEDAGAWPRDAYDANVLTNVADGTFPALPPFHD